MMASLKLCRDERFTGKRRKYDFVASQEAMDVVDGVMAEWEKRGHLDTFSRTDFEEMTEQFDTVSISLWDICVPPGWQPSDSP
ncbi:MAG: hypothetical protein OXE17_08250 [Chloroflexi bacterium]|nr:hypothetical protein [Chloroflexota bacterium]